MDFQSMKRKELQALCKKHKIPANLSNLEMANRLTEFFKEKDSSSIQGLVKEQDGNGSEIEFSNMVMRRKGKKKVRFSPEHELIEFTRSQAVKRRSRRVSVLSRNSSLPVENIDNGEMKNENVGNPGRVMMRSRGSELMVEVVHEKKRGRKGVKCYDKKNINVAAFESDNGAVDNPGRVLRSRGKILVENVQNVGITRGRKRAKVDTKTDEKVLDNVDDDKLIEEIVHNPVRITRNRGQKLREPSPKKEKRGRKVVKSNDDIALVSDETDTKVDLDERVVQIEKQVELELRTSNRRKTMIASHAQVGNCELKAETQNQNDLQPTGVMRRSRRKTLNLNLVGNDQKLDINASVPHLCTNGEVSQEDKKVVPRPIGDIRRSKRKTSSLKLVSIDEKSDYDAPVEGNSETDEQESKPCLVKEESVLGRVNTRRTRRNASKYKSLETINEFGVIPTIQHKNEARTRRNVVSTNNGPSPPTQSIMKESISEIKAEIAVSIGKPAEKSKTPTECRESNLSDASSNESLDFVDSLFLDSQLSVAEGAESINNQGLSSDRRAKIINSDVELTSSRKSHRKKQDVSSADSNRNADMMLTNGDELANPDEKAESRTTELNTDSGEQIPASKLRDVKKVPSLLEFDVREVNGQNITDIDKNDPEAELLSKTVDSSCAFTTSNQVILEGSVVSGNADHQADFKTDGEVPEAESDIVQASLDVVDRIGEVEGGQDDAIISRLIVLQGASLVISRVVSRSVPINNTFEVIDKEPGAADTVHEKDSAIFESHVSGNETSIAKTISHAEHEIFNQADENTNKDATLSVEQQKSSLSETTAMANTTQLQETWTGGSDLEEHQMSMFKTSKKAKTSEVHEGSNRNEDANGASCDEDKEEVADACIANLPTSMDHTVSNIGVESPGEIKVEDIDEIDYLCKNSSEKPGDMHSSESWTEFELNNLFATPGGTPTVPNDGSSQGTEIASLTMSMNKSIAKSRSCLTENKMEMERESECAKTTNENVVLTSNFREESDASWEENQLKLLFATPTKIMCPRESDEKIKENVEMEIKSNEKVGEHGHDISLGISFSDNSMVFNDATNEELRQVENAELVNTCSITVLSEAKCNDNICSEASEKQLTENKKESTYVRGENEQAKIISYEEETDNGSEWTVKNTISFSGSPKNLDKVEGCHEMLIDSDLSENLSSGNKVYPKSEGGMTQSSDPAFELSDSDFQKSKVPEIIKDLTAFDEDDNILKESSNDNYGSPMDLEEANIGSFNGERDVVNKGEDDEITELKVVESNKLIEVEILQSSPIGYALSVEAGKLQSTSKETEQTSPATQNVNEIVPDDEITELKDVEESNKLIEVDVPGSYEANKLIEVEILKSSPIGYALSIEADKLQSTSKEIEQTSPATQNVKEIVPDDEITVLKDVEESNKLIEVDFPESYEAYKLQSTYKETKQTCSATQNVDDIVPDAVWESSASRAESDILTSLSTLLQDDENGDDEKSERNVKEVIAELNLEKNFVEFNNDDNHTVLDVSAAECKEILKESDVADTIQEYIDSESSLSIDVEDSDTSIQVDDWTHNVEKSTNEEDFDGRIAISENEDNKPLIESSEEECKEREDETFMEPAPSEEECKEREDETFMEPAPVLEEIVKYPSCVDMLFEGSPANDPSVETKGEDLEEKMPFTEPAEETKTELPSGSAVNDTFLKSEKELDISSRLLCSTAKKNARTILIHGTPSKKKLLTTLVMKENVQMNKSSSNMGDITTVRLGKRKALQDVQWK